MFCGRCGSNIKDGLEFCTVCGASVKDMEIDTQQTILKAEKVEKEQPVQKVKAVEEIKIEKKKKLSKGKKIAIISICFALIVSILAGMLVFRIADNIVITKTEPGKYYVLSEVRQTTRHKLFGKKEKKVTTYDWETNGNTIVKRASNNNVSTYDINGNLLESLGSNGYNFYYTYDDGRLIKETHNFDNEYVEFEYDENNYLIREKIFSNDWWDKGFTGYSTEYQYDANGNLIRKTRYNPSEEMDFYIEYQYDEGRLIREECDNGLEGLELGGGGEYKISYEYDENGNLSKKTFHADSDREYGDGYYKYKYDNNGYLVEILCESEKGSYYYKYELEWEETTKEIAEIYEKSTDIKGQDPLP